jgi:hypothetical protein
MTWKIKMPKPKVTAKRRPARRVTVGQTARAVSVFDKYGSLLKMFANYGAAGLFGGYILIVTLPNAQTAFTTALEKQAEQNREDRKNGWDHGEKAVEKLTTSMDRLGDKFGTVQATTQSKQDKIISGIEQTNQLLSRQMPIAPTLSPSISNHRNDQ